VGLLQLMVPEQPYASVIEPHVERHKIRMTKARLTVPVIPRSSGLLSSWETRTLTPGRASCEIKEFTPVSVGQLGG
jgi:hypothetical protein